jgi:hypothetical protein
MASSLLYVVQAQNGERMALDDKTVNAWPWTIPLRVI